MLDYSKDECWLEKPTEAKKAVDVFYIYPTVTGFRDPVQICEITDSELVADAKMVRQIQTSVFDEGATDTGVIVSWLRKNNSYFTT